MSDTPSAFRLLIERLSRRMVFRRRLPARFGGAPIWVSPGAALGYFRSLDHVNWRELYDFAEHYVQPGAHVWDIGANVGVFSFSAAHRAGPSGSVFAIEADPWLVTLMRRSAALGAERAPVQVLCAAVAQQNDLLNFEITERTRSGSHLTGVAGASVDVVGKTCETNPVVTISLDWLLERRPPPQVVKIDVEGAELLVLSGARKLLHECRPVILVEASDARADELTVLLKSHHYELWDFTYGWNARQRVERATYNTLAVPRASTC